MSERIVFLNGQYVPESAASVSVFDRAFCAGDGVYDVARTFGHRVNKLRAHCERLCRSAAYTRINLQYPARELEEIGEEVVRRNLNGVDPRDDRILWLIVTRGIDPPTRNPLDASAPTVIVYTLPIAYHRFLTHYRTGAHLITAATRRTPPECLTAREDHEQDEPHPGRARSQGHRSRCDSADARDGRHGGRGKLGQPVLREGRTRLHAAAAQHPARHHARERDRDRAECGHRGGRGRFLPLRSRARRRDLHDDDELLHPAVGRFNGKPLGPAPGPVTTRVMEAWGREVKVDFVAQAAHFCDERRVS